MLQNAVAVMVRLVTRNWLTMFGASLTTVSALGIIAFLILGLLELSLSPYVALLGALILPAVFIFGLILIPVGSWLEKRRRKSGKPGLFEGEGRFPTFDLNRPRVRRALAVFGLFTVINLLILAVASYEGLHYMDSAEFCGDVCHVMAPEYVPYQVSPHASVACAECHIGSGVPWFVRAKVSGMAQVWGVATGTYPTPIPVPVHGMRAAGETCGACHSSAEMATGPQLKVIREFADDETNTPMDTALLLHLGGGGNGGGIHGWHLAPGREVTYRTLDGRLTIPWVSVREADGTVTEYKAGEGLTPEEMESAEFRVMDCMDCHNRPAHQLKRPDRALDRAIAEGRIDREIPFIKKAALEALLEVGGELGPADEVAERIRSFYREFHLETLSVHREGIEQAAAAAVSIYQGNVFPFMKVGWGTYPVHIGHEPDPGCFRCHDGEHVAADGRAIQQDCMACHNVLAWDETDPQILRDLGFN